MKKLAVLGIAAIIVIGGVYYYQTNKSSAETSLTTVTEEKAQSRAKTSTDVAMSKETTQKATNDYSNQEPIKAIELERAADFTLLSATGEEVSLSDYQNKIVVMEWYNKDCPFVRKFYDAKYMQGLQQQVVDNGDIWLTVISSAPGKQGHLNPEEAVAQYDTEGMASTHLLIDEGGSVGRVYGAQTTPHMYVINPKGYVAYRGAIDDARSTDVSDIEGANNYVVAALEAIENGKYPEVKTTSPYGYSVKYSDE